MSFHAGQTFVFGEQPSATKWQYLWDNDYALADGTGLSDGILIARHFADSISPVKRWDEGAFDFIASGCVITADSPGVNRNISISAGVVYINGVRLTVAAVTARTCTASRDVYCDLHDNGDGTAVWVYTDNTLNAASPALSANYLRGGIVTVGAGSIAAAASINQGQIDRLLPIASSIPYAVTDSVGNKIANRDPTMRLLGARRQIASNLSVSSSTPTQAGLLSTPVLVPANRELYIHSWVPTIYNNTDSAQAMLSIWDGVVNSGTRINEELALYGAGARAAQGQSCDALYECSSGLHTFNAGYRTGGSGTAQIDFNNGHSLIMVELK